MSLAPTAAAWNAPRAVPAERPLLRADEAPLRLVRGRGTRETRRLLGPVALSVILHGIALVALLVFTFAPPPQDGIGASLSVALTANIPEAREEVEELEEVVIEEPELLDLPDLPVVYMEEKPLPRQEELLEALPEREQCAPCMELPVSVATARTRPEPARVAAPPVPPPTPRAIAVRAAPKPRPKPRRTAAASRGRLQPLRTPLHYPDSARRRGIQGVAKVEMVIRADGSIGTVRLKTSSGYTLLDEAALLSVRQWQFAPLGAPRRVVQPIRFWLN